MTKCKMLATASFLVCTACSAVPVDHAAEVESLRQAAVEYHEAASAKEAATVVEMYDATAVMVPPDADMVEGLEGVGAYRFGFIETPGVDLQFELIRTEVAESGDIGWTLAVGEITINQSDGSQGRDRVRDFHTWKRQLDGSWKVVVDIWNSGDLTGG